jgi:hypothetical protein
MLMVNDPCTVIIPLKKTPELILGHEALFEDINISVGRISVTRSFRISLYQ